MVSEAEAESAAAVYGHKLSSVVPGSVTGEICRELTGTDLAMKLHYFRGVFYFQKSDVVDSLTILPLKQPMFSWLDRIFAASGRIRRSETGRPYIKCNDCGVRIIEAKCHATLDDWFERKDAAKWRPLVSDKVLGPDLYFSPMVYIQYLHGHNECQQEIVNPVVAEGIANAALKSTSFLAHGVLAFVVKSQLLMSTLEEHVWYAIDKEIELKNQVCNTEGRKPLLENVGGEFDEHLVTS